MARPIPREAPVRMMVFFSVDIVRLMEGRGKEDGLVGGVEVL